MISKENNKYGVEKNLDYAFIIILSFNIIAFTCYIFFDIFNKRNAIYDRASDYVYNVSGLNVQQLIKPLENTLNELVRVLEVQDHGAIESQATRNTFSHLLHASYGLRTINFASRDGTFYAVPDIGHIEEPQSRPWYNKKNSSSTFVYYTPIYKDYFDDSHTVSISRPIFDNVGAFYGSISADLNLVELGYSMRALNQPMTGETMVIDRNGLVLIHSEPNQIGRQKIPPELVLQMNNSTGVVEDPETGDRLFYFSYTNPDWFAVYRIGHKTIFDSILLQVAPSLLIFLILTFVICLMWYLTKNTIHKMMGDIVTMIRFGGDASPANINSIRHEISRNARVLQAEKARADKDPLTGLFNRGCFDNALDQHLKSGTSFSLALIDIDNFKSINDTWGHVIGDVVLRHVAKQGQHFVDERGTVYRYGGEEIAVLFPELDARQAWEIMEAWRADISVKKWREAGMKITFSGGINDWHGEDAEGLISSVDALLYKAKHGGKNQMLTADSVPRMHAVTTSTATTGHPS
ncbi:diguanylate cyclase [Enterobacteriaceae bacterium 4M9]|nr:diguanylate cyclase [Enterobacteriaceae bacterium 4M9]